MKTESGKLVAALRDAIAAMSNPVKNKQNPHFKNQYADLGAVLECIEKPLHDNGLLLNQQPTLWTDGVTKPLFVLETKLCHVDSGEFIVAHYPLPEVQDPQKLGSAISYARRYALKSLFNMVDEDDDGESANGRGRHQEAKPKSQPQPAKKEMVEPFKTPEAAAAAISASKNRAELRKVGIIIGTSNFLPEEKSQLQEAYAVKMENLNA